MKKVRRIHTTSGGWLWFLLLTAFLAVVQPSPGQGASNTVFIAAGSTWKYSPFGYLPGWQSPALTDSYWPAASTPVVDPANTATTRYYRYSFTSATAHTFNILTFRLRCDDGAVVYVNGSEVFRHNMPAGEVYTGTCAATNVSGAPSDYVTIEVRKPLSAGLNVVAVEIHQACGESNDFTFDLEMKARGELYLLRGPYVQLSTPTSTVVRWRTEPATTARVRHGPAPDRLTSTNDDTRLLTEHELNLTNLGPNTRCYYSIGTTTRELVSGPTCFFVTAPTNTWPARIWVTGDTRSGDPNQEAMREACYTHVFGTNRLTRFEGANRIDVWLTVGDNAGMDGRDEYFQTNFFDFFPELLRQTAVWPALGNHDRSPDRTFGAYMTNFTLPAGGQAGGVASGCEYYYSFDYGNIHFIILDSTSDTNVVLLTNSAQYAWLERDLRANKKDWTIAVWHHPPYTRGAHESYTEIEMTLMCRNYVPMLEAYGVDVVIGGHSHSYERSMLLNGRFDDTAPLLPTEVRDGRSGRPSDGETYVKPWPGPIPQQGAVYVVAGSGGLLGGGALDHPAMVCSTNAFGSLLLEFDGQQLDGYFLRETGQIGDWFRLFKGPQARLVVTNETIVLTWNSLAGKTYRVESCDNALGASCQTNANIVATGSVTTYTGPVTPWNRFFRIRGVR